MIDEINNMNKGKIRKQVNVSVFRVTGLLEFNPKKHIVILRLTSYQTETKLHQTKKK